MNNNPTTSPLFASYQLGDLQLRNSIVMAPLTRCKADDDLVPTEAMAAYYGKRAGAGFIIAEATIVLPNGQGYPNTPGIFSPEQIAGWRRVTDCVHENGGKMFLQLWHVGRVSHSSYLGGELPVAPSAVPMKGRIPRTDDLQYETPRALETEEISDYANAYAQGATNAIEAGFDGVEIHGANGYLIDQFLHEQTNTRTDQYGGSPENRARFALEVVDAVATKIPSNRVGIRLSPAGHFNDIESRTSDADTFHYLLKELGSRNLAYVHSGIFDDSAEFDFLGGRVTEFLRKHYTSTVIGNGNYTPETAQAALQSEKFDLVALGRPFIANPDLVSRLENGLELVSYDESMLDEL